MIADVADAKQRGRSDVLAGIRLLTRANHIVINSPLRGSHRSSIKMQGDSVRARRRTRFHTQCGALIVRELLLLPWWPDSRHLLHNGV